MENNVINAIIRMEDNLKAFTKTLTKLNEDDNLVLGGSYALMLNGINLGRTPDDVDIVIYNPTEKQQDILENLRDFNILGSSGDVFKLKVTKNEITYTLDILIEREPLPNHLLYYISGPIKIRVQNVLNIIKAKASYKRRKDLTDLLTLKNLNFNLND